MALFKLTERPPIPIGNRLTSYYCLLKSTAKVLEVKVGKPRGTEYNAYMTELRAENTILSMQCTNHIFSTMHFFSISGIQIAILASNLLTL